MLSARGNGLITFWNTRNIEEVYTFQGTPAGENALCMCLSDSNDTLVVGDYRGYVIVYDLSRITERSTTVTHECIQLVKRFKAHTKLVSSVAYISKYNLILSASYDNTVILFDCYGVMIGFFGQTKNWQLGKPITYGTQSLNDLKLSIGLEEAYDDGLSSDEEAEAEKETQRVQRLRRMEAEKRRRKRTKLLQQGVVDDEEPEEQEEQIVATPSPVYESDDLDSEESEEESEDDEDDVRLPKISVPDTVPKLVEIEESLVLPDIMESPKSKKTSERKKKKNTTTSRFEKVYEQENLLENTIKNEQIQASKAIEMLGGNVLDNSDLEESVMRRTKTTDHFPERFREFNKKVMMTKIGNQDWLDRVNSLIEIEDISNVKPELTLPQPKDRSSSRNRRENTEGDGKPTQTRIGTASKPGIDDIKLDDSHGKRLEQNIENFLSALKTHTNGTRYKKHV